jgi:hypothetical protein
MKEISQNRGKGQKYKNVRKESKDMTGHFKSSNNLIRMPKAENVTGGAINRTKGKHVITEGHRCLPRKSQHDTVREVQWTGYIFMLS